MDSQEIQETITEIENLERRFPDFNKLNWTEKEFLKCKVSFQYFAGNYVDILNPAKGLIKFGLYGYQKRCVKEFENYKFNIISKFRQGGLTTLAVLWSLWRCMFLKHQSILILSKTDREAVKAGKIARNAIDNMKYENAWLMPELAEDSKHTFVFKNTGSTMAFHTPEAARGSSVGYVIIDEAAFIPKMDEYWKAMYPVISTGGSVIVISTVNGRGNWYEKQYTDALNKRNRFNVIDLDYTEHPDYQNEEWVKQTRANIGEKAFAQEYLRSFLGSGDTFISNEILAELSNQAKKCYPMRKLYPEWDTDKRLDDWNDKDIDFEWEKGAFHIYKEPEEGHEYIIGADSAQGLGEEADNSTFQIIDMASLEQVAEFSSNTVPPHVFAQILSIVGNYYNVASVALENLGPGLAVIEKLRHTLYYENLYYEQNRSKERAGITSNRVTRPLILESMQNYLQNRFIKVNTVFIRQIIMPDYDAR